VGGKLRVVTDFLDNPVTLGYNGSGQLASITDPAVIPNTTTNRVTQFGVTAGQLTQITEPDPGSGQPIPTLGYAYESHNKLLTLTDPDSHQTAFTYSSTSARVSTVTRADNTTESLVPQQATGLVASGDQTATLAVQAGAAYTDPRGKAWFDALDWSGFGHPTERFDPLLDEAVMHRNNQGLAWLIEDPLDRATRAFFDNRGRPTEYVLPDRRTDLYTYNDLGEVASFTDPNGHTTTMTFRGGPIAACRCPASVTQPPVGSPPTSPVTTISWDDSGFPQSQTDPNNNVYTYHYDGAARVGSLEEPPDVPAPTTNPTVTFGYNSENYLTSVTDELSHVTTFQVDNLGRVLWIHLPTGGYVTMAYDRAGNRTSLSVPTPLPSGTDTTQFQYDAMNRVTSVTDPNGQVTTYSYMQGVLQDIYDRDTLPSGSHRDTHFMYDDASRLITEQWKDGSTVDYTASYGYDAASELTSASDNNSAYSLAYDNRGHEISIDNSNTLNIPHVVVTFGYDAVGNRTQVLDNFSPSGSITFAYDADNRLTGLTMNVTGATDHPVVTLQYDIGARLTSISRSAAAAGNQVNTALTYTQRNLVQSITHTSTTGSVTLVAYTYGYDLAKNLQTKSDQDSQGTLTFAYSYDPLNQLTGVTSNNSSYNESYSYSNAQNQDLNGNRSSASFGSTSQTYGAPAPDNRLTTDGQYTYTYDNEGNLVNKTGMEGGVTYSYDYTYDFRNRLTEAKKTALPGFLWAKISVQMGPKEGPSHAHGGAVSANAGSPFALVGGTCRAFP
jgi:YD repeat-containing protein